ncbi:MAG TPA: class I SAM-dependent methyltransferase [Burkholderiales bacterium]|nr:class I SAM-dependent methyltransferase [Burkholderiales bacterium]
MTKEPHPSGLDDVRSAAYGNYGRDFQDTSTHFDAITAARWGKAYRYYLRDWFPKEYSARIGELACGNGKLLHLLKELGYTNLYGVDISADQVASARQVVATIDHGNALDWLAERGGFFDLLIALDFIEHLHRHEVLRFLDLCQAALKPGGRLILQTPNADSPFGLGMRYNDPTHEWAFNANQLGRLLMRAGFGCIECRCQGPIPWGYSWRSTLRWFLWLPIQTGLQIWNIAETGTGLPVLTRVFLISALRA